MLLTTLAAHVSLALLPLALLAHVGSMDLALDR
jgi:hypothetical protein